MGAIGKYVSNEIGRGIDTIHNIEDRFKQAVSSVLGYVGTAFEVAKNGETFVGLQYSQIEPIRESIRAYVAGIQSVLDKLNEHATIDNAIRGEAQAATKEYVKAVAEVAKAYTSALLAYSDKMYEYGEAYKANDTSLQSNIKDEASALSSTAEVYTEKH